MALHLHHGACLEQLGDAVADILATPLDDPFAAEVIAVPTAGVRDLLVRRLAPRLGAVANVAFPFPGRFVDRALGRSRDDDPWQVERLTWAVLAALDRGHADAPGWATARGARHSRRYAVARRIADLFDQYASNRPQLLVQWAGDGEHDDWQARLWRAVRDLIGVPSPAELLPRQVADLRSGELEPDLPPRVCWFGLNGLPVARLEIVEALAARREVHVFAIHPSPARWERTPPVPPATLVARRRREAAGGGDGDEDGPDADAQHGHPLLDTWARPSDELAAMLRGIDAVPTGAGTGADAPQTLLGHLQSDLRADRPPTPYPPGEPDDSVQVHACHGATRQLEVLRDALGHLFVADPRLRPEDVVVLCPELARFEPFAAAVFARGTLPVPLAITDLALGAENPIAAGLSAVLRVAGGRATSLDLLDLATLEPVRRRLGFSDGDLERVAAWVERLGTAWGFDADHRRDAFVVEPASGDVLTTGTWDAALRSILAGAALPAPVPRVVELPGDSPPVVPHDDIDADGLATAGRLAELIDRLRHLRRQLAEPAPPAGWYARFTEALGLCCAADPAEAHQMSEVVTALADARAGAESGPAADTVLDATDAVAMLDDLLRRARGRLRLRTGAVTMTAMTALRNVPAKVVCLLGFDADSMRPPGVDGDDRLAMRPCVGEPDPRADRRQLVLDAMMAARQHLVIVCDGRDLTTNRRVRFAVALSELLDVVDQSLGVARGDGDSPIVRHHPLRGYDDANVGSGEFTTFDDAMAEAALIRRNADGDTARPTWSLSRHRPPPSIRIDDLVEACTRPARTLLRHGLDVRLPGDVEAGDTNIPIEVTRLERAAAGNRLLDAYRAEVAGGARTDLGDPRRAARARWRAAESLAGRAPPGLLAVQALDDVAADVDALLAAAVGSVGSISEEQLLGAAGSVAVDLVVGADDPAGFGTGPIRLVDDVAQIHDAGRAGRIICDLAYTRAKARITVRTVLRLAAAVAAAGTGEWAAVSATRAAKGSGARCEVFHAGAAGVAAAQGVLDVAAAIYQRALGEAVPLFEEASRKMYVDGKPYLDEETLRGGPYARGDLDDPDTGLIWGDASTADLYRDDPRRYADLLWGAIADFALDLAATAPRGRRRGP